MKLAIYWFRTDLRLHDNPSLLRACEAADYLLPVFIRSSDDEQMTPWGFERQGVHRKEFMDASAASLANQLEGLGSALYSSTGKPVDILANLVNTLKVSAIYCESIEAPYENQEIKALQDKGINIQTHWQSSMIAPSDLPFEPKNMPDVFTSFRQSIERTGKRYTKPIDAITKIPPLPQSHIGSVFRCDLKPSVEPVLFAGGEHAALIHLNQYFTKCLPDSYKKTRNELSRFDSSSKFSPWLATGCISARWIAHELQHYEEKFGANDGTYWLWFELLWRDYFRFLAIKHGARLFHRRGLGTKSPFAFEQKSFRQWTTGSTGELLVDAGMRELSATGFLSNRMRQIVGSYWIYTMQGNWQAGAAWFESQLIDYDVYSNQGNWLYIAGHGTDPRGGRAFNMVKQAQEYDPNGDYRRQWSV
ncbi:MAG: DASH family cryptochrome [Polynucleobacter sp.]|nr:DASH family cryptochrome [Polynucleobacter sp.]